MECRGIFLLVHQRMSLSDIWWCLFRHWHQSLVMQSACWTLKARVHCTTRVWVIGLRMWSSCCDGASIPCPLNPTAFQFTVQRVCPVSGQTTSICHCCCCCHSVSVVVDDTSRYCVIRRLRTCGDLYCTKPSMNWPKSGFCSHDTPSGLACLHLTIAFHTSSFNTIPFPPCASQPG